MAEYEACATGLEGVLSTGLKRLEIYEDSSLVVCQMQGKWRTKDKKLIPYQEHVENLSKEFEEISSSLPRDSNQFADALSTLISMVEMEFGTRVHPFSIELRHQPTDANHNNALTIDERPWYANVTDFIKERRYPKDVTTKEKRFLRYTTQFVLRKDILYKRSYDGVQLLCIDEEQAKLVMDKIHQDICDPYMTARMMTKRSLG
ncbi:uncharacterized protein LOC122645235 [Telopea speciosissima]|uniref:uncharacterized protein LOC122645235 n=1 Tax=Telopea speciosissima TaxID=54955 RepID=UPI001CC64B44|nr:uncharacterized protein LOC122645235 [Telopea speciosissima]